eukprot:Hpha_TRINITY_DN19462_c0_g1::TRINITY_DN19462_c0_g1_i1::g.45803::m.45803
MAGLGGQEPLPDTVPTAVGHAPPPSGTGGEVEDETGSVLFSQAPESLVGADYQAGAESQTGAEGSQAGADSQAGGDEGRLSAPPGSQYRDSSLPGESFVASQGPGSVVSQPHYGARGSERGSVARGSEPALPATSETAELMSHLDGESVVGSLAPSYPVPPTPGAGSSTYPGTQFVPPGTEPGRAELADLWQKVVAETETDSKRQRAERVEEQRLDAMKLQRELDSIYYLPDTELLLMLPDEGLALKWSDRPWPAELLANVRKTEDPAELGKAVEAARRKARGGTEYDKESIRKNWLNEGKVPIFTSRPAYTEIGLRTKRVEEVEKKAQGKLEDFCRMRDRRETELEKARRFERGIESSFETAKKVETNWYLLLQDVGRLLGFHEDPTGDRGPAWSLLRASFLRLLGFATDATAPRIVATLRSIGTDEERARILSLEDLPAYDASHPRLRSMSREEIDAFWVEDWRGWVTGYVHELVAQDVSLTARDSELTEEQFKLVVLRAGEEDRVLRKPLSFPLDARAGKRLPRIVSVRSILPEDARISQHALLRLGHFVTSDPLPVQRVMASSGREGVDFFSLPYAEQIAAREKAPDDLYEGAILVSNDGDKEADFCLPVPPTEPLAADQDAQRRRQNAPIAWSALATAPQLGSVAAATSQEGGSVECDVIQRYTVRGANLRKRMYVMRDTVQAAYLSYVPSRLTFEQSTEKAAARLNRTVVMRWAPPAKRQRI